MPNPSLPARDKRKGTPKDTAAASRRSKIKNHAEKCLAEAYRSGASLANVDDIDDVLQKYADDYAFPDDHFNELSTKDRCNLLLKFMDSKRQATRQAASSVAAVTDTKSASSHTSIQFGQTTPTQSPGVSECDEQSEGRSGEESHDDSTRGDTLTIIAADVDADFDIAFYDSDRAKFELLSAARCKNERSYISVSVAERYNIGSASTQDRSIRLTWKYQKTTKETRKTQSTRFWYIEDVKIATDIVLGTGFDKSDEPDEPEHGSDDEAESLSDDASDSQQDEESNSSAHESSDETDHSTENETDTDGEDMSADYNQDSDDDFVRVDKINTISRRSLMANNPSDMRQPGRRSVDTACQILTEVVLNLSEHFSKVKPRQVVKPTVEKKPILKKPLRNQLSLAKPPGRSRPKKVGNAIEPAAPIATKKKRHTSKDASLPTKRREGQKSSRSTKVQELPKPTRKTKDNG